MRSVLCLCLIPAIGYSADPPVKSTQQKRTDIAWAWANACPGADCASRVAKVWADTPINVVAHPSDLPESGCHCGGSCDCGKGDQCKCSQKDCYSQLRAKAIAERKPLIVSVGCEPRTVAGTLSCRWDAMPGVAAKSVVIGMPGPTGELVIASTLPCAATDDQIKWVTQPKPAASVAGAAN